MIQESAYDGGPRTLQSDHPRHEAFKQEFFFRRHSKEPLGNQKSYPLFLAFLMQMAIVFQLVNCY